MMNSEGGKNYLNHETGIWSWLTTVDHKRIGLMYLFSITFFFFVGGIAALIMRTELAGVGRDIIDPQTYNVMFTLHGAIMIFLFIVPGIPATMGNFLIPLMIGAKDVAFPRLNLLSYYIYVFGAFMALIALVPFKPEFVTELLKMVGLTGPVDTGWTFYAPYSLESGTAVVWMTGAAFVLGFSSILTGLNFIVTIHKLRAPGMEWGRLPVFIWASYATAIIQVLATPVVGISLLLLIMERVMGVGIFNPELGAIPSSLSTSFGFILTQLFTLWCFLRLAWWERLSQFSRENRSLDIRRSAMHRWQLPGWDF